VEEPQVTGYSTLQLVEMSGLNIDPHPRIL
jgi:hypothetical protein